MFRSTHPRGMRPFSSSFFSLSCHFNPRICEGCDEIRSWQIWTELNFNPRIREGCDGKCINNCIGVSILIHASARDATAKSYKIDSDFTVLFRKFIQKLGIVIFRISIFFRKARTIFFISVVRISRDSYVASDSR